MEYTLTLDIAPDDLKVINNADQRIALAKPAANSGKINVIWIAFDPFESNTVKWTEDYWIYASSTSTVANGATLNKLSEVQPGPAVDGSIYSFGNDAVFGQPVQSASIDPGTFAATNNMSYAKTPALTFGLSQSAQVNQKYEERMPISATSVLATQTVQITPFTHVYIWLEAHFESSTIITDVAGLTSVAKFGGDVSEITMNYNGKAGVFTQG